MNICRSIFSYGLAVTQVWVFQLNSETSYSCEWCTVLCHFTTLQFLLLFSLRGSSILHAITNPSLHAGAQESKISLFLRNFNGCEWSGDWWLMIILFTNHINLVFDTKSNNYKDLMNYSSYKKVCGFYS